MLLEAVALIGGLVAGSKLNISNELLLGGSLLASVIAPSIGTAGLLLTLGLGVSTIVKNIVKDKYTEKKEEIELNIDCNISEEEKEEVAVESAKSGFWCFTSTLAFNSIPLQLLSLIKGLSTLLMPISIITLVIKGWTYITDNPSKAIKGITLTALVSVMAFYCITNLSTGGVFTYFLALISIPSLILKKKQNNSSTINNTEESINNVDSFLYGGNTNNTSVIGTSIVLGQTILWGSGKDVLGTVVNNDISVLLDPYRFTILLVIISYLFILGNTSYINKTIEKSKKQAHTLPLINTLIKLVSIIYCLITFNPLLITGLVSAGLIINLIDNNNYVRNISIPLLLIIGILTGF